MVPVAPFITGITVVFTFHICWISIVRSSYFKNFFQLLFWLHYYLLRWQHLSVCMSSFRYLGWWWLLLLYNIRKCSSSFRSFALALSDDVCCVAYSTEFLQWSGFSGNPGDLDQPSSHIVRMTGGLVIVITQSILRQFHSLIQSEFWRQCELVLPVSTSRIILFS